jgi:CARDB
MRRVLLVLALALTEIPAVAQEDATEVGVCNERVLVQNIASYDCLTSASIACGSSKSGTLDTNDCVRHDWGELSYWDAWYFSGTAGQTVTITIASTEFDPAFGLFDPSGGYAAESDNVPGVEARSGSHKLQYRLPVSGTWMILATSALSVGLGEYDHINVLGKYSLALGCANLGLPNLVPYKPAAWSDKIVVSTVQGGTADVIPLLPTDRLYVSWAMANVGTANPDTGSVPAGSDVCDLYIDGVRSSWGYCNSCPDGVPPAGTYTAWSRSAPVTLTVGAHQLRLVVDPLNLVPEGDETDNEYVKTVVIAAPPPPLVPRMPVIHSVPVKRSR